MKFYVKCRSREETVHRDECRVQKKEKKKEGRVRETEKKNGNGIRERRVKEWGGQKWKLGKIEILMQSIKVWIGHGPLRLNPCISSGSETMSLSLSCT